MSSVTSKNAEESGPAYLRIAADLRARIERRILAPGDALPPERDLCIQFGVSRMTARRALMVLEHEGLVHRDATRGTFVSQPKIALRIGSLSRELERTGHLPSAEVVWAEERSAGAEVAEALGLSRTDRVIAIQRLRRSDDEPIALETTFYPASAVPNFLDGDLSGSFWDRLATEYNLLVDRTVAAVEFIVVDGDVAERLDVREASGGIRLTRHTYLNDGRVLEYAIDAYRADRVTLVMERTLEHST